MKVLTTQEQVSADPFGLRQEVACRLRDELSPDLRYHDAAHTLDEVLPAAMALGQACGLDAAALLRLEAAALLHDIGFTLSRVEHEAASAALAREILPRHGFASAEVDAIAALIMATRPGDRPTTLEAGILVDADLDVLGRPDFWRRHVDLKRELALHGEVWSDLDWVRRQAAFLADHRYYTDVARQRRDPGKLENQDRLERRQRRLEANVHATRS